VKVSARTEYAAIAAVEIARQSDDDSPVRMRSICEAQQIPARFLVHILLQLNRAGIVKSVRGAGGGYAALASVWEKAAELQAAALERVTLADLVQHSRGISEPMYYI